MAFFFKEVVIVRILELFTSSDLSLPAKPWLPNLKGRLSTPKVKQELERNTKILLGLLDIPSEQLQEVYHYDITEASYAVIFSSPGYGN